MDQNNKEKRIKIILETILDFAGLSLMFVICSIPIITVGASLTAIDACCMRKLETGDEYVCRSFWENFKKHFRQSTVVWSICMLVFALFGGVVWYVTHGAGSDGFAANNIVLPAGVVVLCLAVMECMYVFPIQAKFNSSLGIQVKNALILSIRYFPTTVLLSFVMSVIALLLYFWTIISAPVLIVVGIGAFAYMYNYFMLICFKPYLEPLFKEEDIKAENPDMYNEEVTNKTDDASDKMTKNPDADGECEGHDKGTDTVEAIRPADSKADEEKKDFDIIDFNFDEKTARPDIGKKSIQLSDALEDERKRLAAEKRSAELARIEAVREADREARETAAKLADKVKQEVSYETAGENVYRRALSEERMNKSTSKVNNKKKRQRKV